ncbi:MAG: LemA family protein [Candidatus Gastranaerophilales bacterium]|nr:LemA family protein [Candidatus Gastranaerophilales bacterium]
MTQTFDSTQLIIALALIIPVILALLYIPYVTVIKNKNKVQEALSSIDVQLKRRYDLIPNILTIAQKFMDHERSLIEDVTKLRTQALENSKKNNNIKEQFDIDKKISSVMGKLLVSVENYPQLKSDNTMTAAIDNYQDTEDHIAAARRFYNAAVLELNNSVEIFPTSLYATMMGIKKMPFFEADEAERKPINASDYLK